MKELGYKEIQSTLDGIADAIVILDRKWHLEWYNQAFLQIVDIAEIEKVDITSSIYLKK